MADDTILDSQITASPLSVYAPHNGRLNQNSAWSTHEQSQNQWIQVNLTTDHFVYGVQTQGYSDAWTKSFKVDYSPDGGTTWQYIIGADGQPKVKYFGNIMIAPSLFCNTHYGINVRLPNVTYILSIP